MKKTILLITLSCFLFTICSCGEDKPTQESSSLNENSIDSTRFHRPPGHCIPEAAGGDDDITIWLEEYGNAGCAPHIYVYNDHPHWEIESHNGVIASEFKIEAFAFDPQGFIELGFILESLEGPYTKIVFSSSEHDIGGFHDLSPDMPSYFHRYAKVVNSLAVLGSDWKVPGDRNPGSTYPMQEGAWRLSFKLRDCHDPTEIREESRVFYVDNIPNPPPPPTHPSSGCGKTPCIPLDER